MERLALSVGGLLYSPASNKEIARHILNHDWPCQTAVSLCLEDSIQDSALQQAEEELRHTLETLANADGKLPLLFVRVRTPEHLWHVHDKLGRAEAALTGYIFPKFDMSNAEAYLKTLTAINHEREGVPLYGMPILESKPIASILTRRDELSRVREMLDAHREQILNVRVGGNDFSNLYGLRRTTSQTIYDLGVVRDALLDILNVFADDYVVSGPVWEYYGNDPDALWATGLKRELNLDRANGFMGKTAIHPSQLPLIYDSMKVSRTDYEDARQIVGWTDSVRAVGANSTGSRMNEVKCHSRWAGRILALGDIYGIRED